MLKKCFAVTLLLTIVLSVAGTAIVLSLTETALVLSLTASFVWLILFSDDLGTYAFTSSFSVYSAADLDLALIRLSISSASRKIFFNRDKFSFSLIINQPKI